MPSLTQEIARTEEIKKADVELLSRSVFETAQSLSKRRMKRKTAVYALVLAVFLVSVCSVIFAVFFRVKTVTVAGLSVYDDWRIIEASGIVTGESSYSINRKSVEERIKTEFPYISSVSLTHLSPSALRLTVTEEAASYYFVADGEYVVLSDSLRVLEIIDSEESFASRYPGLLQIYISGLSSAIVGSEIEFAGKNYYDYTVESLKTFAECSMSPYITMIDCSNIFNVFFVFDNRFRIEVGDTSDLTMKLSFASSIIAQLDSSERGTINVENQTAFFIAS